LPHFTYLLLLTYLLTTYLSISHYGEPVSPRHVRRVPARTVRVFSPPRTVSCSKNPVRVFSTPSNSLSRSPQRTASQRGNCSADVPTTMPVMQGYSLANYPKAVCVDSSPAMYYFLAATSVASANTWIVYLRGGGVCMPYFAVRRHPCS